MRVLIADDHRWVGDALAEYLKHLDPEIEIFRAESLAETLGHLGKSKPADLILLDLKMPGMNDFEGLAALCRQAPDIRVVMLSELLDQDMVAEALDHGVMGFIPRDMSGPALIKVLELILVGETFVPTKLFSRPSSSGADDGRFVDDSENSSNPLNKLTAREREVLALVVKGHSNKQIARELGISTVTAAFHLRGICAKLSVSNRTQAATTALSQGWTGL